ncbi:hypothetical protein U9M48_013335 [Paspalum notatum var. saurae]|uniref:Uncharacterized protein n=1 Tax=Paspalum notatum var. saurae TaxID=547442 RepID=A0AAQ3T0B2_PASNO
MHHAAKAIGKDLMVHFKAAKNKILSFGGQHFGGQTGPPKTRASLTLIRRPALRPQQPHNTRAHRPRPQPPARHAPPSSPAAAPPARPPCATARPRPRPLKANEGEEDQEDEEAEGEDAGDRQGDEEARDGEEDAQADEDLMGGDGSEEVFQRRETRRSHYVNPPPIPAAADKKLIKPIGDNQWEDVTWDGTGHRKTPNGLLGNLIRVHNPGVVEKNGETIPVTTWKHFALAPHVTYGSVQGLKYYFVDPSKQDHTNKFLENAANKICKDLFSNLRIQIINSWLKSQVQPLGRFRDASETYPTAEEYGLISHPLFEDQPGPYKALCDLGYLKNFRSDQESIEMLGLRMQRISLEVTATAERLNARYSMFNGMIDSRQVQRRSSSQSSGDSSSRQRRTMSEMEIDSPRQEIQKRDAFLKAQEEYHKKQQAHAECIHAQQMTVIQAMYQTQGMTFVMPDVAPAPVLPQWEMDRECRDPILTKLLRQPQDNMEIRHVDIFLQFQVVCSNMVYLPRKPSFHAARLPPSRHKISESETLFFGQKNAVISWAYVADEIR